MITQRRIFQAKPGAAAEVVGKMKDFQPIFDTQDGPTCRIYTDLLSGNTDQVVWEFDIDNLSALENLFWAASQNAEYVKAYEEWYEGLKPLVEGARVELWSREA